MNYKIFLILGVFIITLISCGPNDDFKQLSHQDFLEIHDFNIGQTTLNLKDNERKRPIKVEIWYPTKDTTKANITTQYPFKLPPTSRDADLISEKFPLVLLSHGTGGNRISQMWLACELVGNGYVVVAVDHYGNTLDNKIPENFVKGWDRPLDISFTLDAILSNPNFNSIIDTTKIGMAGFSFGGYTSIALAGGEIDYNLLKEFSNTEEGKDEFDLPELGDVSKLITPELIEIGNTDYKNLKDDRIKAFVAMAPAIGQGFKKKEQFSNIQNPVLLIGANNDNRTPVVTNAKHYANLIEGSEYVELEGEVGHYIFMNQAKNGLKRNAPMIFKDDKSIDRKEIHNKVAKYVVDFFDSVM
ncbi:dienelactone hydrolase [Marivirga tractuosa]|uniref:alpha/beta hydrolase family protein n=1 Tax=Marivirga tractuosa TaxID=1006 RepID=UPI0035D0FD4F